MHEVEDAVVDTDPDSLGDGELHGETELENVVECVIDDVVESVSVLQPLPLDETESEGVSVLHGDEEREGDELAEFDAALVRDAAGDAE